MLLFQDLLGRVFLSFLFIRLTTAEGFTNPPKTTSDLTYTSGNIIQITWQSDLERIALTLWHVGSDVFEYLPDSSNVTNTNSYPWVVGSNTTDISSKNFFFALYNPGNTTTEFESSQFKIIDATPLSTGATVSSTSTSTSTSTTAVSSSASTSTPITSASPNPLAATSTQTSNSDSPTAIATNSGISQSAKTGIGVGIGIGIPLLFVMGVYLGWKFRGGRDSSGESPRVADDAPINFGVTKFEPASQEYSMPMMNNVTEYHMAPQELPESRLNELHSMPIHQIG